jgi:hypothetical protein
MRNHSKIQRGDPRLIQKIREHGGIKQIAFKMGMPPSTLANKVNGWSIFTEMELSQLNAVLLADNLQKSSMKCTEHDNTNQGKEI